MICGILGKGGARNLGGIQQDLGQGDVDDGTLVNDQTKVQQVARILLAGATIESSGAASLW